MVEAGEPVVWHGPEGAMCVDDTEGPPRWRIDQMDAGKCRYEAMPEGWRMTVWLKQVWP